MIIDGFKTGLRFQKRKSFSREALGVHWLQESDRLRYNKHRHIFLPSHLPTDPWNDHALATLGCALRAGDVELPLLFLHPRNLRLYSTSSSTMEHATQIGAPRRKKKPGTNHGRKIEEDVLVLLVVFKKSYTLSMKMMNK